MSLCRHSATVLARVVLRNAPNARILDSRNMKRWVAPTLKELNKRRQTIGPQPPEPRSQFLEWNYEAEIYAFGKRLGEEFNRDLLKQALTHKCYVNIEETKAKERGELFHPIPSNHEMIERGGDLISSYIREEYSKHYNEDIVNALHDYLTKESMLAHVGKHIGLADIILTTEFPVEESTLSKTFKAVVAALEQSQDLQRAQIFIKDILCAQLNGTEISDIWNPERPYEYLQNLLKSQGSSEEIEPRLCNESAANTILANYQVGLYNNDRQLLGIGWGESIQIAKDTAALDAIHRIYKTRLSVLK